MNLYLKQIKSTGMNVVLKNSSLETTEMNCCAMFMSSVSMSMR